MKPQTPYTELTLPAPPDTRDCLPQQIIKDYFDEFSLEDAYQHLRDLLYTALVCEKGMLPESHQRSTIIYFCQYLWTLNQAVYRQHISNQ
jgi:hypothetical protein